MIDVYRTEENGNQDSELFSLSQPGLSPFLYVERSLRLFAKRIAAILHHIVSGSSVTRETVCDVLHPEVKHIQVKTIFRASLSFLVSSLF